MLQQLNANPTTLKALRTSDSLTVYYDTNLILIDNATSSAINLNINNTDVWTIFPRNSTQATFADAFTAWQTDNKNIRVFINNSLVCQYSANTKDWGNK